MMKKKITVDYRHFEISLKGTMVWSYITDSLKYVSTAQSNDSDDCEIQDKKKYTSCR